jgi:glycosyltransferase involved in cell wall biosynthesis
MNNTLSLSVILPIKSSKAKDFDEYFEKAISSLKNQQVGFEELVIVHSQEQSLIDILNSYDFGNLNVTKLLWDQEPNYANQVNFGIKNAKGTWVSLFEFDDEYSSIWFKNVKKYVESFPEVQMFLPVIRRVYK